MKKLKILLIITILPVIVYAQGEAFYEGVVLDSRNYPINSVTISSEYANNTTSDSSGRFFLVFFSLPSDSFNNEVNVLFEHPDYKTKAIGIKINYGDTVRGEPVILEEKEDEFNVSGSVKDSTDDPIQYALINFYKTGEEYSDRFVYTDENGNYNIKLPEGDYYVRAQVIFREEGLFTYRFLWYKDAEKLADADILRVLDTAEDIDFIFYRPKAGSISGKVTDSVTKLPVEGAEIQTTARKGFDSTITGSGADGVYKIKLYEGAHTVLCVKEGYYMAVYKNAASVYDATPVIIKDPHLDIGEIDFDLIPISAERNTISGTVRNIETDEPIPEVYITIMPEDAEGNSYAVQTDRYGQYSIIVPNGKYYVLFNRDLYAGTYYGGKYTWEESALLELTGSSNLTNIDAMLMPLRDFGGMIEGNTYIRNSATAISGALITAASGDGTPASTGVSNAEGKFSIRSLADGYYRLTASRAGYNSEELFAVQGILSGVNMVVSGIVFPLDLKITDIKERSTIPEKYNLSENYPNPFNPVTKMDAAIPEKGFTTLEIYDILGRIVKKVLAEERKPGNYTIEINGSELTSGVYLAVFRSANYRASRKIILLK